jgi:hypothetical protein
VEVLTAVVSEELWRRFARLSELARRATGNVETMRSYVQTMLDLEAWAERVYLAATADSLEAQPAGRAPGRADE